MLQPCGRADLGEESLAAERRSEIRTQDLDGDVAIVPEIVRDVHGRHPARADQEAAT